MQQLIKVLHALPRAATIIDQKFCIIESNQKFIDLIDSTKNKNVIDLLTSRKLQKERLTKLLTINHVSWNGMEITLKINKKPTLCWCENRTLQIKNSFDYDNSLIHFLEIQDIEKFHIFEAAFLQQMRRLIDDNLWILDDKGILLWVRASNSRYEKLINGSSEDLIVLDDRLLWQQLLEQAKAVQGQIVKGKIRSAIDGQIRYVDLCFLTGSTIGGRFYVASRSDLPKGKNIVLRLKEAWNIKNDSDLAKKLATSKSAVSFANNSSKVPSNWLIKTGQSTGFSIDWLLTGQGEKKSFSRIKLGNML